jgi:hypothetical protein
MWAHGASLAGEQPLATAQADAQSRLDTAFAPVTADTSIARLHIKQTGSGCV